jgi:hypothetical protein
MSPVFRIRPIGGPTVNEKRIARLEPFSDPAAIAIGHAGPFSDVQDKSRKFG